MCSRLCLLWVAAPCQQLPTEFLPIQSLIRSQIITASPSTRFISSINLNSCDAFLQTRCCKVLRRITHGDTKECLVGAGAACGIMRVTASL